MWSPSEIAEVVGRLSLINPENPYKNEDGDVFVPAPIAVSGSSAITVVNPQRSELLAGLCKRCHGIFTVGIQIQCPPPHSDADPMKVCASCLVSMFKAGQTLKMDWV